MTINNYLQEETNKLITKDHVFFAFSNSQFEEALLSLKEKGILLPGDKLTNIGAGGYMPSKFVDQYIQGQKEMDKQYKKLKKDIKARNDYILNELHNHEVFYTNDLNTFCTYTMSDIPREEIIKVYKHHNKSKCGCNN